MIRFERRSVRFGEVWFDEPVTEPLPDILITRHASAPPPAGAFSTKQSLVTDLAPPEEQIWNSIKGDCRREIRRGQEAAPAVTLVHTAESDDEILAFAAFYNSFAAEKGLEGASVDHLKATAGENRLWLSSVASGSETLARHSYVASGSTVRCLYGASTFRSAGAEHRKKIAHAHRLLHWTDITGFKAAGFERYDWGGLFVDETLPGAKSINDFKRQFGGRQVESFESIRPMSFRGQLYLWLWPGIGAARTAMRKLLPK